MVHININRHTYSKYSRAGLDVFVKFVVMLTDRHDAVFHSFPHLFHGNSVVNEAKK